MSGPGRIHLENLEKSFSMLNDARRTTFTMVDDFIVGSNGLFQIERKPHAVQAQDQERRVTIAGHSGHDLAKGTLNKIMKPAQLTER